MTTNNFLKEIMQGGACNTGSNQPSLQSSNPVKNLINNVILGKAQVRQRMQAFYPEDEPMIQQNIQPKVAMPSQPKPILEKHRTDQVPNNRKEGREMMREWNKEQKGFYEERKAGELKEKKFREEKEQSYMNIQKRQQQQELREVQTMAFMHWNESMQMHTANQWRNKMYEMHSLGQQRNSDKVLVKGKEVGQSKVNSPNLMGGSLDEVINLMKDDADPRFQKSKYLEFLEKMQSDKSQEKKDGISLDIKETNSEEIKEHSPQIHAKNSESDIYGEMEAVWNIEEKKLEEQQEEETEKLFEDVWQNIEAEFDNEEKVQADHEKVFNECLEKTNQDGDKVDFEKEWNAAQEQQEANEEEDFFDLGLESEYEFTFNPENERANCQDAIEFLNLGQTANAILCLESALSKNLQNKNLWKLLGKIYQDNDQEKKALDCLIKAIQLDSKDTDTLLALGVALTNRSDEIRAMKCMHRWLLKNPKYVELARDNHLLKGMTFNKEAEAYSLSETDLINKQLREIFAKTCNKNPSDPELHTSLALLNFIARDYTTSLQNFNEALKFDTKNYSLWNKLGATLAHLGKSNEAINAYYRALEFKPNYVRAWVNLGISQACKGEYEEAARLYLSALSLNPDAQHIWNHLKSTLVVLKRYDLSKRCVEKNLDIFKDEFDIISFEDLPNPEIEYKELNSTFLIKKDVDQWISEF